MAEATAGGSPCSIRGVRRVALDPTNPDIVYTGSYVRGCLALTGRRHDLDADKAHARIHDVASGAPVFTNLTSSNVADPG